MNLNETIFKRSIIFKQDGKETIFKIGSRVKLNERGISFIDTFPKHKHIQPDKVYAITNLDDYTCGIDNSTYSYDLDLFQLVKGREMKGKGDKITKNMKSYIGCKKVDARLCTKGYYLKLVNALPDLCEESEMKEVGYIVKYNDGYVSWSPKDVFEGSYMEFDVNPKITRERINRQVTKILIGEK